MTKKIRYVLSNYIISIRSRIDNIENRIKSRFINTSLFKGLLIIGTGTAISQILIVILLPVLTRIYSPENFGTLAVFMSLLSVLSVGAAFKYELAIPLPENNHDAEYLLFLSFFAMTISTLTLIFILVFFEGYIARMLNLQMILPFTSLLCVGLFVTALYQTLTYWAIREKDYLLISHTKILQSISSSVSKIILGIGSLGAFGLIVGEIIGRIVGIIPLGRIILPKFLKSIHEFNLNKILFIAKQYKRFPKYSVISGFINELGLNLPTFLISAIFGFQTVGLYVLAFQIVVFPVSVVSSSMSQVFFGELSDMFRDRSNQMLIFYLETAKKLFLFGAPLIFSVAIISPFIFPLIFGSAWKDAGIFTLPLSILVVSQFVVSPIDRLELLGFNHWELYWNIGRTFFIILGFYIAFLFQFSPSLTVLIYSLIMMIMYVVNFVLNVTAIKRFTKIM